LHRQWLETRDKLAADEAAVKTLAPAIRPTCGALLAGAPDTASVRQLRNEVYSATALLSEQPERPATIRFAQRVRHLRWSRRKLTYHADGSAEEELANAELTAPDICADARTLASNGFQHAAPSTTRFLRAVEAANSKVTIENVPPETTPELQKKILRLLRPYEQRNERGLIPPPPWSSEQRAAENAELIYGQAREAILALGLTEIGNSILN